VCKSCVLPSVTVEIKLWFEGRDARIADREPRNEGHRSEHSHASHSSALTRLVVPLLSHSMEGPGPPPDGWEWHWSRTFERHYLWSPTTNAVRWPPADTESTDGPAGPECSASEPVDEDGAVQGLPSPASIDQPEAAASTEFADDGSQAMDADSGVNEYFIDFGDLRVGFPERKPAVTPQMHGWTYPPLIELVDRLLCFGGDATKEHPEMNVIIEVSWSNCPPSVINWWTSCSADVSVSALSWNSVLSNQIGSWLGCSTRLLAQLAPQVRTHRSSQAGLLVTLLFLKVHDC
jgi:hypothetical protein